MTLPAFGGPSVFRCDSVEAPVPRADQISVRVAACGVCGHDLLARGGHFPHVSLPATLGHEIAGTVEEVGELVTRLRPGDRVALIQRIPCGLCRLCRGGRENVCTSGPGFYGEGLQGGYGEIVVASERNAVRLPAAIPFETACVLSCAIGTGFHALRRAGLELGETVVITGAGGGVGLHAVAVARLRGQRVIAISTSASKSELLKEAGADEVIVAPDLDFHRQVRDLTGGLGADAVIEITGRPSFASSLRSVRAGGRIVVVGNVEPGSVSLNPAMAILKEVEIVGSAHATVADLEAVVALVEAGRIKPRIADVMPVAEVAEAHRRLEAREVSGRIVLRHGAP